MIAFLFDDISISNYVLKYVISLILKQLISLCKINSWIPHLVSVEEFEVQGVH